MTKPYKYLTAYDSAYQETVRLVKERLMSAERNGDTAEKINKLKV